MMHSCGSSPECRVVLSKPTLVAQNILKRKLTHCRVVFFSRRPSFRLNLSCQAMCLNPNLALLKESRTNFADVVAGRQPHCQCTGRKRWTIRRASIFWRSKQRLGNATYIERMVMNRNTQTAIRFSFCPKVRNVNLMIHMSLNPCFNAQLNTKIEKKLINKKRSFKFLPRTVSSRVPRMDQTHIYISDVAL